MKIEKLAGIDIGSNAVRLLVTNVITEKKGRNPSFRKSALVRVPIRLGADTFIHGAISEQNKIRMIKAMKAFKFLMEVHGVTASIQLRNRSWGGLDYLPAGSMPVSMPRLQFPVFTPMMDATGCVFDR